jgi:bacillithiol biosynthesis cysteine-adding enzyme BshC
MNTTSTAIAYGETGFFSGIVLDYLRGAEELKSFYTHPVSVEGIKAAIESRKSFHTDKKLLVDTLLKHYGTQQATSRQLHNINLLNNSNCFTVTTAHQPNIFTGHLYFMYKILHAIKLCEHLKTQMPENDFVPVFYMGSEDADLDELGHVYINGIRQVWQTSQTGAVGRMKVDKGLIKLLADVEGEISIQPFGKEIIELMKACYTEGATIEQATFKLVNNLFGELGLIVLLPDNADYKKAFIPVIQKELQEQFSYPLVEATVSKLPKAYKVQASGRALNMFYLKEDKRERIEKINGQWSIVNSKLLFNEPEILKELHAFPERFSPNVILRPVFQEMLLPNIAFIGGGGEIAYWLELKKVFEAVQVPFPVLVLRNSFLVIEKRLCLKVNSLGFGVTDLFKPESELFNVLVKRDTEVQLGLHKEKQEIQAFYAWLSKTAGAVDKTLQPHTQALEKLALRKIEALEKKMLRAEKKKFEAQQRQLHKLKELLFPHHNLQERIENLMPFYALWGKGFIKAIYDNSGALDQEFVLLEEQ